MATDNTMAELELPYPLTDEQIDQFQRDGYIKLKHVLSPDVLGYYGQEITRQVVRLNQQTKSMEQRTTYEKAFLQIMNLWRESPIVKELVFSTRLARIATELMRVAGVRLNHDQALYKEAGGGITPWHADQYYWPFSNSNTVTIWIPLQATPLEMGPLEFSIGSQHFEENRHLAISDESERKVQHSLKQQNYRIDATPYELGEVSYHSGWTFHRAGANSSGRPRAVMTVIYMDDEIRLVEPRTARQLADLQRSMPTWMPGAKFGDVIATELNPVLYRR